MVAICIISNCNRRAPPDQPFCSAHRDARPDRRDSTDAELLRELHNAMAVVLVFRRLSATTEQRLRAEEAIAVWRKVALHLGVDKTEEPADGL